MKFHERFKELLEDYKEINPSTTQAQIAHSLDMTPQAFSYYLNGREPNYDTLIKLSDFFKVSTDYLVGKSEYKNILQKALVESLNVSKRGAFNLVIMEDLDKALIEEGHEPQYEALKTLNTLLTTTHHEKFFSSMHNYLNIKKCCFINDVVFSAWIKGETNLESEINYSLSSDFDSKYIFLSDIQNALNKIREELEDEK